MTLFRYKKLAINIEQLRTVVPGNPTLAMSSSGTVADIDIPDEFLPDLDEAMALDGFTRDTTFIFRISGQLVAGEVEVTSTDWVTVGGVVANPSFFSQNLPKCINRILGEVKVNNADLELRLVERESSTILGTNTISDTSNTWESMAWWATTPPTDAGVVFYLEARLINVGLLPSAAIRFVSAGLCET